MKNKSLALAVFGISVIGAGCARAAYQGFPTPPSISSDEESGFQTTQVGDFGQNSYGRTYLQTDHGRYYPFHEQYINDKYDVNNQQVNIAELGIYRKNRNVLDNYLRLGGNLNATSKHNQNMPTLLNERVNDLFIPKSERNEWSNRIELFDPNMLQQEQIPGNDPFQ